jgi:RNA polymerase sigma-70 factor (ECF subfamily)
MLAQDVTFTADGGGKVPSVRQPVHGRALVAKLLLGLARTGQRAVHAAPEELRIDVDDVNGEPALLLWVRARLDTIFIYDHRRPDHRDPRDPEPGQAGLHRAPAAGSRRSG